MKTYDVCMLIFYTAGWNAVMILYNSNSGRPREMEALRGKFKSLRNCQKPTGDPTCPPQVIHAKRIQRLMEAKQSVTAMDDDEVELDEEEPDLLEGNRSDDATDLYDTEIDQDEVTAMFENFENPTVNEERASYSQMEIASLGPSSSSAASMGNLDTQASPSIPKPRSKSKPLPVLSRIGYTGPQLAASARGVSLPAPGTLSGTQPGSTSSRKRTVDNLMLSSDNNATRFERSLSDERARENRREERRQDREDQIRQDEIALRRDQRADQIERNLANREQNTAIMNAVVSAASACANIANNWFRISNPPAHHPHHHHNRRHNRGASNDDPDDDDTDHHQED